MATISQSWIMRTIAGTGEPGYAGDGSEAVRAQLNEPKGLAVDRHGHVYIADSENHLIRRIDRTTGVMTTVAGYAMPAEVGPIQGQEPAAGASDDLDPFAEPSQAATDKYQSQTDLSGTVRYVVGAAAQKRFSGDGGPACAATLNFPTAVAVDEHGHIYIADTMNHRVRRVDAATGLITTVAGTGQPRYAGDGGPGGQAALNEPSALALDGRGYLYIADQSNNRVRELDLKTGLIRTLAGMGTAAYDGDGRPATESALAGPSGLACSEAGLYIADTFNNRIRCVDLWTGLITTVAGDGGSYRFESPAEPPSSSLSRPTGIALDHEGALFLTDSDSHLVRRWDTRTKTAMRVAGIGTASYGGDGGAAVEAALCYPFGIVADGRGTFYLADTFNHRIRTLSWE